MTSALAPVGGGASVIETTSWSPGRSTRGSATRGPSHNRTVPFAPSQCDDTETGRAPSGDSSTELALRIVTATGAGAERDTELMLNPTDARRSAITVSGRSSVATPCAENHDTPSRTRSTRSTYDPAVVGASTITAVCVDAPGAISAASSARAPSQRTMPPFAANRCDDRRTGFAPFADQENAPVFDTSAASRTRWPGSIGLGGTIE